MLKSPFDVLHQYDDNTSAKRVNLRAIAAKMESEPEATREQSIAALAGAAPQSPGPRAKSGDPAASLRWAMGLINGGDAYAGYVILDQLLIEWQRRDGLEKLIGTSILDMDAAAFRAVLEPLGTYTPQALKLGSEHLEAVAAVLRSSAAPHGAPALSVGGSHYTRAELIANMGLAKPSRRFVNPCRPLRSAVTAHPQKEARWKGKPIRYIDVSATPGSKKRPPLVLIHGHASCAEEYDPLIEALRPLLSDVRILVPDMPGSGYSWAAGHGVLSTKVYRDFICDWLADIGVPSFVPAGGSMGGNLTLQLLASCPPAQIPTGISWSPVAWRAPSNALDWLARGALVAKALHLFWPVYDEDKGHWYPNWAMKKAMVELAYSDAYRHEVHTDSYEDAYFDLAHDQCTSLHLDKATAIRAPVLLMAGKKDIDIMSVYESTKALPSKLSPGVVSKFYDDFEIGDHSLATEEPARVAEQVAQWYNAHIA